MKALTKAYGCYFDRPGSKHDIYARDDIPESLAVPRHKEISPAVLRNLARKIHER